MSLPFEILVNDLLPIFLVASVGYLLSRVWRVDVESVSRITFNALTPCLVFHLLITSTLGTAEIGRLALMTTIVVVGAGGLGWLVARVMRLDRTTSAAFLIAVMFANVGNYGLSVVMFAFGAEAMARASIYFVTNAVMALTLGVVIASGGRARLSDALVRLLRSPVVYAIVVAAAVTLSGATLPLYVERPVALLAGATIPVMLLVLGMQFQRQPWPARPVVVAVAVALVLVVRPAFGWLVSGVLALEGTARQAALVESAMPTAVLSTIIALEFGVEPALVTAVVVASTVLSPVTVTAVIWLIKSGW